MTVSESRVLGSAGCSCQRESRQALRAAGAAGRPSCLSPCGPKMSKARSLPCGASSPDPVPKQSQRLGVCVLGAQPVDPTPSQFGSQAAWPLAAAGFAQLPHPRQWLAVPSSQKEMWPEVRNEGGIAEESSEGRDWLLGRNTSALWPGAVDRGLPAGRIIGLSTALPTTPGMNYFRHTSQQKSTCWLLFLE